MNGFFPQTRIKPEPGNWFHNFMYTLDRLAYLPAPVHLAAAALIVFAATRVWPGASGAAFGITSLALAGEAGVLIYNQRSLRSPGPFAGPFALFTVGHAVTAMVPALLFYITPAAAPAIVLHIIIQAALLGLMLYGSLIEPFHLRLREETVNWPAPGNNPGPLKIILISDLHLDRRGTREESVMGLVRAHRPDLILFPGDLTNLSFVGDDTTARQTAEFITELAEIAPVYVSRGTPEVDTDWWVESILGPTPAVYLDNRAELITIAGHDLWLIGVPYDRPEPERIAMLERIMETAPARPVVLLHHSPDLIETAARLRVDLYVAGHTHGGQIRLPFYGPLYTASRYGHRFAFGLHRVADTTLVVSQGIGLEGAGAPRLRFLSPPEIVAITLIPNSIAGPGL